MDTIKLVGTILEGEHRRDAIHVAMAPMVAGGEIYRAAFVGLNSEGKAIMVPPPVALGISDPFMREIIEPGQQFFVWLRPGTITDLRHHWTHPEFPEPVTPVIDPFTSNPDSVVWLKDYAEGLGETYEDMMSGAAHWLRDQTFWLGGPPEATRGSNLEGVYTSDRFWSHYQLATGVLVSMDRQDNFFTCVC